MSIQDAATLKSYFQTGDKPTQSEFGDLVDTLVIGPHLDCGTTSGAANIYNLTADADVTALTAGQTFTAIAHQTNTGACTSSVNGLSSVQITKLGGTALAAGDIVNAQAMTLYYDGNSRLQLVNPASISSAGTVTSVGLSTAGAAELTVGGSPVNTSGTLTLTKANQAANTVWAGPATGAATAPTFRSLVVADLPAGVTPVQNLQVFTGSGTFTAPAATLITTVFKFTITGGGGSGGISNNPGSGGAGGGGAGATCIVSVSGLVANAGYSVTVGAGGIAGNTGGNSSVTIGSTTYTAAGGVFNGSTSSATPGAGGIGGVATNGTLNITGGDGTAGGTSSGSGGVGGASYWGGGSSGGLPGTNAADAKAYGAGGGGGGSNCGGYGLGKQGVVTVEWTL